MDTHPAGDTTSPDEAEQAESTIVLHDVRAPILDLLRFYDQLERDGRAPIADLDRVIVRLKALPPRQGQLGRDLRLIAGGGRGADRATLVAVLTRLRALVGPPG